MTTPKNKDRSMLCAVIVSAAISSFAGDNLSGYLLDITYLKE